MDQLADDKDRAIHALRGDEETVCENCGHPAWRRRLDYHPVPQPSHVVVGPAIVVCSEQCGELLVTHLGTKFYYAKIG